MPCTTWPRVGGVPEGPTSADERQRPGIPGHAQRVGPERPLHYRQQLKGQAIDY
jgi:hypothetical protein